jgi:xylulokinase
MSLLGIDVGTTACKVMAMTADGVVIAEAQCEYPVLRPQPGWAEQDAAAIWTEIQDVIRQVVAQTARDPVVALCADSMGESIIPVSADRRILGPAILGFDTRGEATIRQLQQHDSAQMYERVGNVVSGLFAAPKLAWLVENQPKLIAQAYKLLNWADLVAYMLGAEGTTDYALANRYLLLDVRRECWSPDMLAAINLSPDKLPTLAQAGTLIGEVSPAMAASLGLPPGVKIVLGTHDQCANATGAGVWQAGVAMYGIGTFITVAPAYHAIPPTERMLAIRLGVEHHALRGLYISCFYNLSGGALLKWFRDTFAAAEHAQAKAHGADIYDLLLAEMPPEPTDLLVLPHFGVTGPPYFDENPFGMIAGLTLTTSRGEFVKALLEGMTYYFRHGIELMAAAGIPIERFRAVGGGAKSDRWLQIKADILGLPLERPRVAEAGVFGSAILAGLGSGVYESVEEPMAMIEVERVFEPNPQNAARYAENFARYLELYPAAKAIRDKVMRFASAPPLVTHPS